MKIFVIVVTYNGKQWYDQCFTSLRESTIPVQTVVVDNTPGKDDAEYIKMHYPEVHLIKPKENLGFGRANNIGMRYALDNGCEYVFLLNQDAWIKPDTLSIMKPIVEQHTECGLYSPMHIGADEKSLYIEIEDGKMDHANCLLSDCYFQTLKDLYYFKYINAAAWLLPRKTLETIGGFDPMFFMYGEDDNYLQRLSYHKILVGLIPKAQIIHNHVETANSIENNTYRAWQTRLTQYLNIEEEFSASQIKRKWKKKMFQSLLEFDFKNYRSYRKELQFLRNNRKSIERSRAINMQQGMSWLN